MKWFVPESCSGWSRPRACWAAWAPGSGWQVRAAPLVSSPTRRWGSSPHRAGAEVAEPVRLVWEEWAPWWRRSCSASAAAGLGLRTWGPCTRAPLVGVRARRRACESRAAGWVRRTGLLGSRRRSSLTARGSTRRVAGAPVAPAPCWPVLEPAGEKKGLREGRKNYSSKSWGDGAISSCKERWQFEIVFDKLNFFYDIVHN